MKKSNTWKEKALEEKLGFHFSEKSMLLHALTHSSYANEHHRKREENNERLEFLGDAVLEMVSSEILYKRYPSMPEGEMTKFRASLVCEQALAACARELSLGEFLLLGKGEDATGGRERNSILSDALEAVIGAMYLDGGFTNVKEFIERTVLSDIEHKTLFYDSKTTLQEVVQGSCQETLSYRLLREEGPEHEKCFTVCVCLGERELATGTGRTKKAAEQEAAYKGLLMLRQETKQ